MRQTRDRQEHVPLKTLELVKSVTERAGKGEELFGTAS
jgi:hypothetical protein